MNPSHSFLACIRCNEVWNTCYRYLIILYLQVRTSDQGRFFTSPVLLVPESPEQNALHCRVAVERLEGFLVEVSSLVFILSTHVQLCHPDWQTGLGQQIQSLLMKVKKDTEKMVMFYVSVVNSNWQSGLEDPVFA